MKRHPPRRGAASFAAERARPRRDETERGRSSEGVIRRSLPIVGALVLIGIVAVNAVKQIQGPLPATARVYHTSFDLSAALAQIDLASSTRSARSRRRACWPAAGAHDRAGRRVGEDGGELQASTEVTADGDSTSSASRRRPTTPTDRSAPSTRSLTHMSTGAPTSRAAT